MKNEINKSNDYYGFKTNYLFKMKMRKDINISVNENENKLFWPLGFYNISEYEFSMENILNDMHHQWRNINLYKLFLPNLRKIHTHTNTFTHTYIQISQWERETISTWLQDDRFGYRTRRQVSTNFIDRLMEEIEI